MNILSQKLSTKIISLLAVVIFLFVASPAFASIGFDHGTLVHQASGSSLTSSYTLNGTQSFLTVGVYIDFGSGNQTISGMTWNGAALSRIDFKVTAGSDSRVELWQLSAPVNGTHNLIITATGTTKFDAYIMNWTGVGTANGSTDASGSSGTASVSLTSSVANSEMVSILGAYGGSGLSSPSDTVRVNSANGIQVGIESEDMTTVGSYSESWNSGSTTWAMIGTELLPAVPGCTDSTAINYDSSANYNDGSCTYPPTLMTSSVSGGITTYSLTVAGENYLSGLATAVAGSFPLSTTDTWYVLNAFAAILVFGLAFITMLWSLWFFYHKARY